MRTRYVPQPSRLFQDAHLPQILLNGSRLGMIAAVSGSYLLLMLLAPGFYEPIRKAANRLVGFGATEQNPVTSVFAGAASGVVGGCLFDTLDRTPRLISFL
jgi:hypothetical protein